MEQPLEPGKPALPGVIPERFTKGKKKFIKTASGIPIPDDPRFPKNIIPENYAKDQWIPYSGGSLQYNDDWGWTIHVPAERTMLGREDVWYRWKDFAFENEGPNPPSLVGPPAPTKSELEAMEKQKFDEFLERVNKYEREKSIREMDNIKQAMKEESDRMNRQMLNPFAPVPKNPNAPPTPPMINPPQGGIQTPSGGMLMPPSLDNNT